MAQTRVSQSRPTAGYHITNVVVDGVSQGAITSYPFTFVTASHSISATFAINTYTITSSAGAGGTISPSGTVIVNYGTDKSFSITPGTGYALSALTVDGASQTLSSTYTFLNVTTNHTIVTGFTVIPTFTGISPGAGPVAGGTSVAITGTGFTGATAVTFGGTAATTFTVNNANSITAAAPAHSAATVDVVITTPGGSATGTGAYTYAPVPTFSSISVTSGPTTGGTFVTIFGSGFTGATSVSFGGTPATPFTVNTDTSIGTTAPAMQPEPFMSLSRHPAAQPRHPQLTSSRIIPRSRQLVRSPAHPR